jgi:hypothetical protein
LAAYQRNEDRSEHSAQHVFTEVLFLTPEIPPELR